MKKSLGIVLMIFGIGAFLYGNFMQQEVSQKEAELSQAEENIQDQRRPVLGPVRRGIENQAVEEGQEKIGQGEAIVAGSQVTANWLQGTGAALFVIGLGTFFCGCRCQRKQSR